MDYLINGFSSALYLLTHMDAATLSAIYATIASTCYAMLNAKFGWKLTGDDVVTLGQRILSTEIDFNRRAGITQAADVLPDFFTDEKLPPHNTTFDITHEELKTVFNWIEEKK